MGFNSAKFDKAQLDFSTKDFDADFLRDFWEPESEDDKPIIKIRQLKMGEFIKAQTAAQDEELKNKFFNAMSNEDIEEFGKHVNNFFNSTDEADSETAQKALFVLKTAITYPEFTPSQINTLCKYYPVHMLSIYSEINKLTEKGGVAAKKKQS